MNLRSSRRVRVLVPSLIIGGLVTGCAALLGDFEVGEQAPVSETGTPDVVGNDGASDAPVADADTDSGDSGCRVAADGAHLTDAVMVAAGSGHTCAIRQDGALYCWGDNAFGQLGVPQATTLASKKPIKVEFPAALGGAHITRVAVSENTTFAIDSQLRLWAFGNNATGLLANGAKDTNPHAVPAIVKVSAAVGAPDMLVRTIAPHWYSACALTTTSDVKCWGDNQFGQLGPSPPLGTESLVPVDAFPTVVTATAGAMLAPGIGSLGTCYRDGNGPGMRCWGGLAGGYLLNAGTPPPNGGINYNAQQTLVAAGATNPIVEVEYGTMFGCARDAMKRVWCWGTNNSTGVHGSGAAPAAGAAANLPGAWAGISAGYVYVCAIDDASRTLHCRGSNAQGQLGRDTSTGDNAEMRPVKLPSGGDLTNVRSVSAGFFHACAIVRGSCGPAGPGQVKCWGKGDTGQIGDDQGVDTALATDVAAP